MKKKTSPEIKNKLFKILSDDSYGICPAPMTSEDALSFLCEYLLGSDYICGDSLGVEQGYTNIVIEILKTYSKEFKKDLKDFNNKESIRLSKESQDVTKRNNQ